MTGNQFASIIHVAFDPFLHDLGFALPDIHLNGRYYRARFRGQQHTLIVTFEPGDTELTIILLRNSDDGVDAIDDPEKTPRLKDLNRMYQSGIDSNARRENEAFFADVKTDAPHEHLLLKCAKDLRLVLPIHLRRDSSIG